MKKHLGAWILMIVLCLCVSLNAAAEESGTVLLVYMVGSDLESENGLAAQDLMEMQTHFPQDMNVTVLVCLGGAKQWSNGISPERPTVYALDEKGLHKLHVLSDASMTSTESLSGFLSYAYTHAPSENTALILWDHGSGPLIGFGVDETANDDKLTFLEMKEAFSSSPYQGKNRLRWIGFDACLMGSLEMAVMLEPYAEALIASEEVELPCGWDYSFVSMLGDGLNTTELVSQILDRFYDTSVSACGGNPALMPSITLAAYDLSKSGALVESLQELFSRMHTTLEFGGYAKMARVRAGFDRLGRFSGGLTTDLVDLRQFADTLREAYPEAAEKALKQLEAFIIRCATNNPQYSGLSVYFPYDDKASYLSLGKLLYQDISFSDAYTGFVDRFANDWLKGTLERTALLTYAQDENGTTVGLPEELLKDYESARYIILEKTPDGYIKYLSDNDVCIEDGALHLNRKPQLAYLVREDTGERFPIDITFIEENEAYWFYHVPMLLKRFAEETEYLVAELQIAVDKQSMSGMVISAYHESNTSYGKQHIKLTDWDVMEYWNRVRVPVYDASRQLLLYEQWETSSHYSGYGIDTNAPFHLEIAPAAEYNAELYAQFSVRDIYGNLWNSDLIAIQQKRQTENRDDYDHYAWEDPNASLLMLDRADLRLELINGDLQTNGKIYLKAENKTDKALVLEAKGLAVNQLMIDLWIYERIPPHESVMIEISVQKYPFRIQPMSRYESLRFNLTLSDENDYYTAPYYEGLYDIEMNWPLLREPELESYLRRAYAAPFWLKEQLLYEDEFLCVEAEPVGDYKGYDGRQETTLFLKCRNKAGQSIRIQLSGGYLNEWMFEESTGITLMPDTWGYLEVPVNHEQISGDDDVMGLMLEWITDDRSRGDTVTLAETEFQYAPSWLAQDAFASSSIGCCVVEDMRLERWTLLSSSTLDIQIKSLSERSLLLCVTDMKIDGAIFDPYASSHLLLPGKRIQMQLFFPDEAVFQVSPYAQPVECIQVDMNVLDAQTNQKLDSITLQYRSFMPQHE